MSRTLFRHDRIWTGSRESPWTDALLVEDGRIVAIGADARDAAGGSGGSSGSGGSGGSTTVDLPGAVVMPGLHDAHIHTEWLSRDLSSVDLREARSLDETLELIRAHAAGLPDGVWLHSGRWNHNRWTTPVQPDRHALDTVTGGRVAALASVDGHTIWANSLALQRAGITRDTPDPVGGEIVRDSSGEPTGILREKAQELLDAIPREETPLRPWLERCQEWLLSVGLTSITDIDGEDARAAYADLHADGALRLRVTKCTRDPDLELAISEGRRSGQGDDVFRVGPVKFFSDGALGSHTAHMTEPFIGHEGCGIAAMPYEVLLERTLLAARSGLDVITHAIGDEANRLVLDSFEAVRAEGLERLLRIEHAQHVLPVDIPRFRALDVVASMQPSHCTADLELADEIIGPRRLASYAWRSFLDAGVRLAFGSDAPVEDPNPFYGLHAAVTRQRADGHPAGGWRPDERITLAEAVHAHTVVAHESVGRSDVGRLVPGQLADLIAVDRDVWALEESAPARIRDTEVLQTWVGGALAHDRS
ncbi:amidohydrolase [Terrabacter koreensis]